jgi:urease accessory protein
MGWGFAASLSGFAVPMVEVGIALSVVALGAAAAFGLRMSAALGAAVCALFAGFHGVAHGAEMPAGAAAVAYFAGFALSTAALLGAGVAAVRFGRVARIAGLGVAGAGLALLAG